MQAQHGPALVSRRVPRPHLEPVRARLQASGTTGHGAVAAAGLVEGQPVAGPAEQQRVDRPTAFEALTVEGHLVPVRVGEAAVAGAQDPLAVHVQLLHQGSELVRGLVGPVVGRHPDPDPPPGPHLPPGEAAGSGASTQRHQPVDVAPVHGRGGADRHEHQPPQQRWGRVRHGADPLEKGVHGRVPGVADLQVQVGRAGPALSGPGDPLTPADPDVSLLQPEIDGVLASAPLLGAHPLGGGLEEPLQVPVHDDPAVVEPLVQGAPVSPGAGPQPLHPSIRHGVHAEPGLAPGLQVYSGVEGGAPGLAEGGGEGRRLQVEGPAERRGLGERGRSGKQGEQQRPRCPGKRGAGGASVRRENGHQAGVPHSNTPSGRSAPPRPRRNGGALRSMPPYSDSAAPRAAAPWEHGCDHR